MSAAPLYCSNAVDRHRIGTIALIVICVVGLLQVVSGAMVPVKAFAAQLLLEHAFARGIIQHRPQKPWPWADMRPIARLRIPRLGIDRIVLDSGSGQAMAFGPTLLPGGAKLGSPGVSVIAAHRDTHFRFLRLLRPGDLIEVQGPDGLRHHYRVVGSEVVRWDRFTVENGAARNRIALATCFPFDAVRHGPLRYVVHAEDAEASASPASRQPEAAGKASPL